MLTRDSILNLAWHARYGENPIIGGDPVLERDSAGYVRGQSNILRSLPRLNPRIESVQPNGASVSVPSMLLECACVNRMFPPSFSSWTNTNVTVTAAQPDSRGGSGAYLLNATSSAGHRDQAVTLVGDGTKAVFVVFKKGTATVPVFGLWDANGGGAWLGAVSVTWNASGPPTLAQSAGTVTSTHVVELAGGYWLCAAIIPSAVAAHSNQGRIYPGGVASTGSTYCDHFQVEDGAYFTSVIDSSSTAGGIRAVDKFYFSAGPVPGNLLLFGEFIYGNDKSSSPWRGLRGSTAGAHFGALHNSDGTFRAVLHNGSSSTTLQTADIGAVFSDRVTWAALMKTDRSARVIAQVNRLAVYDDTEAAGATVTHPASFLTENTWMNGFDTSNVGASRYTKLFALDPSDMITDPFSGDAATIMAELANFSELF